MLQAAALAKSYGAQVLFNNASFSIVRGERLALIGRNGSGKSTLFKLILDQDHPDSGQITMPKEYRCGHLAQHIAFSESSILKEACLGLRPEERDQEYRAKMILGGLGFLESDMARPPEEFSGGFQIRVSLAKTLLSKPNLLLLDEPTNYLDIVSLRWLTRFLMEWPDEIIAISHDRAFLDSVCTHSMIIHRGKFVKVQGGCDKLIEQVLQDEEIFEKTRVNLEKKKQALEVFINRFRAKSSKASSVQSKIKAVERLGIQERLESEEDLDFRFSEAPFHGRYLLEAADVKFSYPASSEPERHLINGISLAVTRKDRIGIIGKNGRGKSTFLRLLAGELRLISGGVRLHDGTRVGYFGQTNIDTLSPYLTIEEEVWGADPAASRTRIRNICGTMMFEGDAALKKISVLSGGERSRVLLGKILALPTNLLLLDEPTNHLDIESVEALVEALKTYKGAVFIVTHSELILRELATKLVVFGSGGQQVIEGGYEYFLDKVGWEEEQSGPTVTASASKTEKESSTAPRYSHEWKRERGRLINERAKALAPVQKEMQAVEDEICRLEARVTVLNKELVEAFEQGDHKKFPDLTHEVEQAKTRIEELFERLHD